MSAEILIIPVIWDLVVASSILMETQERASIMVRTEKGLLTAEEKQEMLAELDGYKRNGHDVLTGADVDTRGSSVLIRTNKGYDVGLQKNPAGAYDVVVHWQQAPGKVEVQQVRQELESKIKQKYAYEKVKRELAKKGFMITTDETQPDESIRLVARKW
ncbi:MAG TPA: DUF1257 domain-containing protein [Armatimonadota bacterium]|jgi:hypothetical protein